MQANYQKSTLHYIADIRSILNTITPNFPADTPYYPEIPLEFQCINSGRIKIATDAVLRMQDYSLIAEIRTGIFNGMDLPDDIRSALDNAVNEWSSFTGNLSEQLGNINNFIQNIQLRKFDGKPPDLEDMKTQEFKLEKPTLEEIELLDTLFARFWDTFENKTAHVADWDQEIINASSKAAKFVFEQQQRLSSLSTIISVSYVCLFLIGSIVSIIAAIKSGIT